MQAIGFSTSTSIPAARMSRADASLCSAVGTARLTASMASDVSSVEVTKNAGCQFGGNFFLRAEVVVLCDDADELCAFGFAPDAERGAGVRGEFADGRRQLRGMVSSLTIPFPLRIPICSAFRSRATPDLRLSENRRPRESAVGVDNTCVCRRPRPRAVAFSSGRMTFRLSLRGPTRAHQSAVLSRACLTFSTRRRGRWPLRMRLGRVQSSRHCLPSLRLRHGAVRTTTVWPKIERRRFSFSPPSRPELIIGASYTSGERRVTIPTSSGKIGPRTFFVESTSSSLPSSTRARQLHHSDWYFFVREGE